MKNGALLALVSVGALVAGSAVRSRVGSFDARPTFTPPPPRPSSSPSHDRGGLSVLAFLRRHGSPR